MRIDSEEPGSTGKSELCPATPSRTSSGGSRMAGVKRFAIIHPPEIVTANHLHRLIVFKVSHS